MQCCLSRMKAWLLGKPSGRSALSTSPEMMARLSHELRTMLTGIVGYAEFLEVNSAEPMMNFTAKIIRESGQNLARTSNSFFDLHHLNEGQMRLSCSRFVLSDLVREVVKSHQNNAAERDVSLGCSCAENALTQSMNSDLERMRQVLDILVFGALQSVEKWGVVHVDLALDDAHKHWVLSIATSGSPAEVAQVKLLESFWNDADYKFRLQQGPGVEMALAKALVYFLGGTAKFQLGGEGAPRLCVMFPLSRSEPSEGVV